MGGHYITVRLTGTVWPSVCTHTYVHLTVYSSRIHPLSRACTLISSSYATVTIELAKSTV
jgi:hypothetical protein